MPAATLALERPRTPQEAVSALGAGGEARVLAGGQSLVPMLTLGFAAPDLLVSLDRCEGLGELTLTGGEAVIGAMVTTRRIETDEALARCCPLLGAAAAKVGSPHVRNFGTFVGNLCHADPGSDLIPAALCAGVEVEVRSSHRTRRIGVEDLLVGPFVTSLQEDELAISAHVPLREGSWRHGYRKLALRAGDLAVATVAVMLRLEGHTIAEARLAVGGALGRAERIAALESALAGTATSEAAGVALATNWIEEIPGGLSADAANPVDYLEVMLPRFVAGAVRDTLAGAL